MWLPWIRPTRRAYVGGDSDHDDGQGCFAQVEWRQDRANHHP